MNPNILVVEFSAKQKVFQILTAKHMVDKNINKIMTDEIEDFVPIGFFIRKQKALKFIEEIIDAMKKDPITEANEIINNIK